MARSMMNTYELSNTRNTDMNGLPYTQHPLETKAASILNQFSNDQRHLQEYKQSKPAGLKIESYHLMADMADNLRRDGFTTHDPAPGHAVNAVEHHMETCFLPPLRTLPLPHPHPHLMSLQRTLPPPPVKLGYHPSPYQSPAQPFPSPPTQQNDIYQDHHHDHDHDHQQQQQDAHQDRQHSHHNHHHQDAVMDGDETEEEPKTTPSPSPTKPTLCKFNGQPCRENTDAKDAENPRKVVSHIFGRNKICTVFIPDECWVWWCRKHYQRCRYHTDNWALKQIDILFENLDKIEAWGGVESFTLALRKRENDRNVDMSADKIPASRRRAAGRLSSSSAKSKTKSTTTTDAGIAAAAPGDDAPVKLNASGRPIRSPVNIASPVPRFLMNHVGQKMSFNEVRAMLQEIRLYVRHEFFENNKEVAFPDVEILPNYTQAVLREKGVPGGQLSENNHSRRRRARKPVSSARGRAHPYASNASF